MSSDRARTDVRLALGHFIAGLAVVAPSPPPLTGSGRDATQCLRLLVDDLGVQAAWGQHGSTCLVRASSEDAARAMADDGTAAALVALVAARAATMAEPSACEVFVPAISKTRPRRLSVFPGAGARALAVLTEPQMLLSSRDAMVLRALASLAAAADSM